jgi:large subunit ribosomal protein L3
MIGLIGKKIGMTQIFKDNGNVLPVSIIEAGPCPIVQIKDEKKNGYNAIQLAFGKKKRINKTLKGHLKKAKIDNAAKLFEMRVKNVSQYKVGEELDVSIFKEGEKISVSGWTKGRGFSGGVKRWGWHGGPSSHGSMAHRRIGSAGPGTAPGRIWKNKTMPGRYGNEKITIKNLEVVKVQKQKNIIFIKGAVPGARNSYLLLLKKQS